MKEIWKDIEGYEGLYQVSNFGNIKSLYFKKEKLLKFITTQQGYLRVMLYKNKKRFDKYVAILVAQAFLPNLLNLETVNHKDGNKSDNSVNNLEWLSQEDNHKHWATKLNCKGHYQKKLNKN